MVNGELRMVNGGCTRFTIRRLPLSMDCVPCYNVVMQKQLTITLNADVYDGLYALVDSTRVSEFVEQLLRPHVIKYEPTDEEAEAAFHRLTTLFADAKHPDLLNEALDDPMLAIENSNLDSLFA